MLNFITLRLFSLSSYFVRWNFFTSTDRIKSNDWFNSYLYSTVEWHAQSITVCPAYYDSLVCCRSWGHWILIQHISQIAVVNTLDQLMPTWRWALRCSLEVAEDTAAKRLKSLMTFEFFVKGRSYFIYAQHLDWSQQVGVSGVESKRKTMAVVRTDY